MKRSHWLWLVGVAQLSAGQTPFYDETVFLSSTGPLSFVKITGAATDGEGASYVTGTYKGTMVLGDFTLVSEVYYEDVFIAKLSASGTWIWAERLGGNGEDLSGDLELDGTGGLYVTAVLISDSTTYGTLPIDHGPSGALTVLKFGTNGDWQWTALSDAALNSSTHLASDGSGGLYLAGYWNPQDIVVHFGDIEQPAGLNFDSYVARLGPTGEWEWAKNFPSSDGEILVVDVVADAQGNAVVAGNMWGDQELIDGVLLTQNPDMEWPGFVPWVGKWSATGDLVWFSTTDNSVFGSYRIDAVAQGASDETLLLGDLQDTAVFGAFTVISDQETCGGHDALTRLSPSGAWAGAIGALHCDDATTAALVPSGADLICAGQFSSTPAVFGADSLFATGLDAFTAVLGTDGEWSGGAQGGGPGQDGACCATGTNGAIRTFGTFEGEGVFGPDAFVCPSGSCGFISLMHLGDVGIDDVELPRAQALTVFPVPADVEINVVGATERTSYSIVDLYGHVVLSGVFTLPGQTIDVRGLSIGSYLLRSGARVARFNKL